MSSDRPTPAKVRALLKHRGWSQVEAAKRLGISADSLKRYCTDASKKGHTKIPNPTWELLLLFTSNHKDWILVPRTALYDASMDLKES